MTPNIAPGAAKWRWLRGVPLDPRNNSLNLIRLVLAFLVIVDHTHPLVLDRGSPIFGPETLGGWAVAGFFMLSGYLITGSRSSRSFGEYLSHRVARIFPGFLVCLVVVAFGFAPVAYFADHRTLQGFMSADSGPLTFLWTNFTLHQGAVAVSGTPAGVPYPEVWDGSLWTLWYEFGCYIVIGVIFCFAAVRRRPLAAIGIAYALSVLVWAAHGQIGGYTNNHPEAELFTRLLPFFLAGALMFELRRRTSYSAPAGLAAGLAGLAIVKLIPLFGAQLAAPLLCYFLMWLGTILPCPALIKREDISYGVYIYGFPIQQTLILLGLGHLPMLAFALTAAAVTVIPATISWIVVERPAMRRVRGLVAYPWLARSRAS
jgi:peptidoglycan/LPS O-acetylase OafA/YrhL